MTHTFSPSKPNNYIFTVFALQTNSRVSVTPHITFLVHTVVIQLLVL